MALKAAQEEMAMVTEEDDVPIIDSTEDGFLKDLLWVYKQWGGKSKLLMQVRNDPGVRKQFLETIMKLESKRLDGDAKERAAGKKAEGRGKGRRGVVLIMRGIDTPVEEAKKGKIPDPAVYQDEPSYAVPQTYVQGDDDDYDEYVVSGEEEGPPG